jgi:hypothetical protein
VGGKGGVCIPVRIDGRQTLRPLIKARDDNKLTESAGDSWGRGKEQSVFFNSSGNKNATFAWGLTRFVEQGKPNERNDSEFWS